VDGRVRFTLSAAARVTLTVQRGHGVRGRILVAGRAGANVVHLTGRIGRRALAPGRYRLVVSAGRTTATVAFRVTR
jgi:hypothetical protein